MTDEEKKALKNMRIFARVHQDMTIVTAEEMNIALNLIEKQQKEIEELKENNGYHLGFIDGGIAKRYEYEDKIKAKIEEVDYKMIAHQDVREAVKQVLQSLLEKK